MASNEKRTLSIVAKLEDFASRQAARMGVEIERTILGRIVRSLRTWGRELAVVRTAWRATWAAASAPIRLPLQLIDRVSNRLLSLRNVIAGFVAFRLARGAFSGFTEIADSLGELGKVTDRLSGTAESITQLAFAAQISGTSIEQLQPGLVIFQRNLEAARRGAVEQRLAFADLGIELDSIRGQQIDYIDVLATIADRYQSVGSATQRTTALTNAFGEAGAKLGPLLNLGADGLRKLAAEARQRGLVFTREELAQAERFQDALLRVKTALQATFQRLFLASADGLSGLLERVTQFVDQNRDRIIAGIESVGRAILRIFDLISDGVIEIIGLLESIPLFNLGARQELTRVQSLVRAIDQLRAAGGGDAVRAAADRFKASGRSGEFAPQTFFGGVPGVPGSQLGVDQIEALLPQEAALRQQAEQLAVVVADGLSNGLRKQKAALLSGIREAFESRGSAPSDVDLYRQILRQVGIVSDNDVVRAVGAGLIPPEALLEGVRQGLFSSGVLDRIQDIVGRTIVQRVAPTQQDVREQANRIRELTQLEQSLLSLERPTAAVQARLAQLNAETSRADLATRLLPQFERGIVTAEGLAAAFDLVESSSRRALDAITRGERLNQIGLRREEIDQQPDTRSGAVQRAELDGEERRLRLAEAFDQGRLSADELTAAIERSDAATARLVARARGDFLTGFSEAALAGVRAFTDLTAAGEEAGQQLVGGTLDRLTQSVAAGIEGTKSWGAAFKDFGRQTLSMLTQLVTKLLLVRALQGLGGVFGLGGTSVGDALGLADGGVVRGRLLAARKFAEGGVANRPTLGLFGEAGAEAFVPLRGGKIPVSLIGRSTDPGLTVQFQVQAVDAGSFQSLLREQRHELAGIVQNAIETRRGMRRTVRRAAR